jgi:hypothetical protein
MDVTINFWPVLVATIAAMIIGWIWYTPSVFGNIWMRSTGKRMEDMDKASANRGMSGMVIVALIEAYILAHFVQYVNATTISGAVQLAFWVWLGFVATVSASGVLFEGKPKSWWLITNGYQLVTLIVMACILAIWH